MVDDILHYLSMGRFKMEFSSVDIAGLASEIFSQLQTSTHARYLHLEIGPLPRARCDRKMIREVLQNLLANAIKFSPTDAEAVIKLDGATKENENVYSVTDHGIGFDMRYTDKLFRVFERVHATGLYEGSGIGLALVKRIITRHGGRVWAEGKVNEGATIYFLLPTK
jgi:light-regulated signal transduction histidine kinase (bacteriophytochrome)